jgi:hypothetical protein
MNKNAKEPHRFNLAAGNVCSAIEDDGGGGWRAAVVGAAARPVHIHDQDALARAQSRHVNIRTASAEESHAQ